MGNGKPNRKKQSDRRETRQEAHASPTATGLNLDPERLWKLIKAGAAVPPMLTFAIGLGIVLLGNDKWYVIGMVLLICVPFLALGFILLIILVHAGVLRAPSQGRKRFGLILLTFGTGGPILFAIAARLLGIDVVEVLQALGLVLLPNWTWL